jgi:hypothetical protein
MHGVIKRRPKQQWRLDIKLPFDGLHQLMRDAILFTELLSDGPANDVDLAVAQRHSFSQQQFGG